MPNNNIVKAVHIRLNKSNQMYVKKKEFYWHIPKKLMGKINKGDLLLVKANNGISRVIATGLLNEKEIGIEVESSVIKKLTTLDD